MKFLVPIALFVFAGFMTFEFVMRLKSDAVYVNKMIAINMLSSYNFDQIRAHRQFVDLNDSLKPYEDILHGVKWPSVRGCFKELHDFETFSEYYDEAVEQTLRDCPKVNKRLIRK